MDVLGKVKMLSSKSGFESLIRDARELISNPSYLHKCILNCYDPNDKVVFVRRFLIAFGMRVGWGEIL